MSEDKCKRNFLSSPEHIKGWGITEGQIYYFMRILDLLTVLDSMTVSAIKKDCRNMVGRILKNLPGVINGLIITDTES